MLDWPGFWWHLFLDLLECFCTPEREVPVFRVLPSLEQRTNFRSVLEDHKAQGGYASHTSIQRLKLTGELKEANDVLKRGFSPATATMPSFLAFYAMEAGGGEVVTTSVFEDVDGADASNRKAAEIV